MFCPRGYWCRRLCLDTFIKIYCFSCCCYIYKRRKKKTDKPKTEQQAEQTVSVYFCVCMRIILIFCFVYCERSKTRTSYVLLSMNSTLNFDYEQSSLYSLYSSVNESIYEVAVVQQIVRWLSRRKAQVPGIKTKYEKKIFLQGFPLRKNPECKINLP